MMGGSCRLLVLLLALSAVRQTRSECRRPPFWLFALPEDIESIFSGLTSPFILVDNGTVFDIISEPDPVVAGLFSLSESTVEFPVVFCISTEEFDEVNFSISLRSFDPILVPSVTISSPGVINSGPYRFRAIMECTASSNRDAIILEVSFNISRGEEVFCPTNFYIAKRCGNPTQNVGSLGIADGYLNQNFSFKEPPTEDLPVVTKVIAPTTSMHISVTLPAVLVPLIVLILLSSIVIFIVWITWYRQKSKEMAEFHPESVSMAYQGVYTPWLKRGPHDKELPRDQIHLIRELGEGAFGIVFEAAAGEIEGVTNSASTDVAVKQLREGSNEVDDFFREVDFMSKLDHPNVVKLIGVCSLEEPFSMIFEYMDLGDLCGFLRQAIGLGGNDEVEGQDSGEFEEPLLTKGELLMISAQVADGMTYISGLGLVHRDLATRNCLVATGLVVKIGDFGMSRNVNASDYYRVKGNALLPVRWMPPESILYGKFAMETDVWAFGILLWEVFTFGQQPYAGMQNEEVIQLIQKGGHPDPPEECPAARLMLQCWNRTPKKRPSFTFIATILKELHDKINT